jgi:hypothetical protein
MHPDSFIIFILRYKLQPIHYTTKKKNIDEDTSHFVNLLYILLINLSVKCGLELKL